MNKFFKIYLELREQIENRQYKANSLLPSENELARKYNVSRETIRKALLLLLENGYIHKIQGKGSIVLDVHRYRLPVTGILSFKERHQFQGLEARTKVIVNEEVEAPEQNQELAQENSNKDIFENPSENLENTQDQNENLVEENSAKNISESQETLAEQNISIPAPENTQPQTFETIEPQTAQLEVAPVFEQQNSAETPTSSEFNQPENMQGLVEAPVQNYAPEIPVPSVPFENPNAFIAETPVQEQVFEPARQVDISIPAPENTQPQTFETIEPQTAQLEVAPVFEQQNSAETPATQEIQTQNVQPAQNQGDEYYHPTENAQIASGLMGAQPYEPSGISREENSAATSNPQNNDYVLSHGKVQNAVYEEPQANENFIPETQPYAQATPIQPLSNFESSNPISNEQYAQTLPQNNFENQQTYSTENPAQNSNDFAMPLPPAMPDFSSMPMPPEVPTFDFIPNPAEQPAMGTENSKNKVMTDQIYPNDPSQFRIPGM